MRSNLFPNLEGQGHLKAARWSPPLTFRWTRPPQGGEVVPAPHISRTRPPQGGEVVPAGISYTAPHSCTAGVALAGTRPPRDGEVSGVTVEIGLFAK
ncbi:hypothetical protein V6N13_015863 [Hibiscus sabdariffa]|uniref:Uncharacterized protein n=1 Tax=Hibiscus sabdariffa TaxID=183260 RepID=A0ABR2CX04_9ROSI